MQRVICGVPTVHCIGANFGVNKGVPGLHPSKTHSSPPEAFECHKRYLLSLGYVQVGGREFRDPKDGYIKVLTKKSHFGSRVRKGKSGDEAKAKRCTFMRVGGDIVIA